MRRARSRWPHRWRAERGSPAGWSWRARQRSRRAVPRRALRSVLSTGSPCLFPHRLINLIWKVTDGVRGGSTVADAPRIRLAGPWGSPCGSRVTERKPPGVEWASWVDRQLDEGAPRRAARQPRGLGQADSGARRTSRRRLVGEGEAAPRGGQLGPTHAGDPRRARRCGRRGRGRRTEAELRSIIERVNERIRYVNSHTVSGPPTTVWTVDPEPIVERWRADRPDVPAQPMTRHSTSTRRPRHRLAGGVFAAGAADVVVERQRRGVATPRKRTGRSAHSSS